MASGAGPGRRRSAEGAGLMDEAAEATGKADGSLEDDEGEDGRIAGVEEDEDEDDDANAGADPTQPVRRRLQAKLTVVIGVDCGQ